MPIEKPCLIHRLVLIKSLRFVLLARGCLSVDFGQKTAAVINLRFGEGLPFVVSRVQSRGSFCVRASVVVAVVGVFLVRVKSW